MNDFYTYAYLREDRTPYYIGKGKDNRAYKKGKKESIILPNDKSRIIFLKQNLTEQEAFKHEKYMIAVFGRKDLGTGILRNKTDGGEGTSGAIRSEETKIKMGESKKGENNPFYGKKHTPENIRKISEASKGENHPQYGKTISEEHKLKLSKVHKGKIVSEETRKKLGEKSRNVSEETRKKRRDKMKVKKWWHNLSINKFCMSNECPGDGWVLGRRNVVSEETRKKRRDKMKGKKWWNDGCGNLKMSIECPGDNWIPGMKIKN